MKGAADPVYDCVAPSADHLRPEARKLEEDQLTSLAFQRYRTAAQSRDMCIAGCWNEAWTQGDLLLYAIQPCVEWDADALVFQCGRHFMSVRGWQNQ